jgi:rRNA-processing protein FCF1
MNDYLLKLIQKYKQKGLLVDTNILLLYIVGIVNVDLIRNFSRTANFTENDFYLVEKFINFFDVNITTPHILTEVSDLLGNRIELQLALGKYIELIEEKFLESKQITRTKTFLQFGLADTAITEAAKNSYLVVTDDNPLFGYLVNQKIDAVNLDQIRMI